MKDEKKDADFYEPERDPKNAEVGSQLFDKLLNARFLGAGNVLNEQKRANSSGHRHNLRFVVIAILFAAAILAFTVLMPYIGEWLDILLHRI